MTPITKNLYVSVPHYFADDYKPEGPFPEWMFIFTEAVNQDHVPITQVSVTFTPISDKDFRARVIMTLEQKKATVMAEMTKQVTNIDGAIQKLLAISYDEEGTEVDRSDLHRGAAGLAGGDLDDIPF